MEPTAVSQAILGGLIADDTRQSRYFAPYARSRPANIDEAEWTALSAEAASIIGDVIYPALNKHLDWFAKSYKPNCAKAPGISAQPGGKK